MLDKLPGHKNMSNFEVRDENVNVHATLQRDVPSYALLSVVELSFKRWNLIIINRLESGMKILTCPASAAY